MKNNKDQGYIWVPWTTKMVDSPSKEYSEFMTQYRKDHEVCPKCGEKGHMSTLMGYVFINEEKENYKDLNNCTCSNCGDIHTKHERISLEKFKING